MSNCVNVSSIHSFRIIHNACRSIRRLNVFGIQAKAMIITFTNAKAFTVGCAAIALPITSPLPYTTFTTPFGSPKMKNFKQVKKEQTMLVPDSMVNGSHAF